MDMDTIAAISTPMGEGGIAIVRVSGKDAIPIVDNVFRGSKKLSTVDSHTIHYGKLIYPQTNQMIDEVLVSVMRAPRTFTKEDIVEVNCHGGIISVQKVLQLILDQGARMAEPGEFTKRAFLNGRIDLTQAEAVIDLIRSKTDKAMSVALSQMEGRLSKRIKRLREILLEVMAHIEVTIDYPEHDVEEVTQQLLLDKGEEVKKEIQNILLTAEQGKILREGLSTVIVGRPNVGKSSLLNTLARESKAIVTDIPGTTRDVIEEYVNVRGVPLKLIDTAGIRETDDVVEKIGVEKSREMLKKADLILFMLNYGDELTQEDFKLIDLVKSMNTIVIINKIDLPQKIDMKRIEGLFSTENILKLSLLEDKGIEDLENMISRMFFSGQLHGDDITYVSNSRHISLLRQAEKAIHDGMEGVRMGIPIDTVSIDYKRGWELLGEITGETVNEDLIDQIFSQFCLGK
ncbi:tRNA uridine-5-carboxymethylaminomethyl(34) synthesis GTPase MnmE [Microaerobacter geothermalis]|uniref:tRNA uridine-5-carboxymethylaminomethyl(34) synthesis GTPase MnmE n=1 Tax=Microaerobacter geothermalis TaxID=674972 RepID=UPI001F2F8058|nr:tRNA uridine-5-carboxymethylaminomethyl(34) synthesis GTPase MnmE [Microaerobacter geothermalis]MCF6095100.1 tRNA uridine-5-carboxymethylaminomethyl(34) synthesis GTPase MnmE [Microaerobacter geothermalis]